MLRLPTGPMLLAAILLGGASLAGPAAAQATFNPAQRTEIEQIIKQYLVKNPEVLQEAISELEKRQQESQRTAQQAMLAQAGQALFNSPHGSVFGNPAGDVTLVEFFDYNCGYCKRALADVRALIKADPKLKVVMRDLPVLGPDSVEASRVALAAKQQMSGDKLFEYHSRLLESRGRIGAERATSLAKEMGLDMARLQRDIGGDAVKAAIAENSDLGEKLALTGTPAFVVGTEVISGAVGAEALAQAIALARK
ncbi:DsbA family protein [uncultured Enterovirga sp.]|uniref:DsbA family protein n=1 Tax=uncultured Enterovirga sp. TaxID=2026352 RepID=UPI0035CAC37E